MDGWMRKPPVDAGQDFCEEIGGSAALPRINEELQVRCVQPHGKLRGLVPLLAARTPWKPGTEAIGPGGF